MRDVFAKKEMKGSTSDEMTVSEHFSAILTMIETFPYSRLLSET